MTKYIADEAITIPVSNEQQVKDTAGKIPEKIGKPFESGDELPINEEEYKQYVAAGFKISKKEVDENENNEHTDDSSHS